MKKEYVIMRRMNLIFFILLISFQGTLKAQINTAYSFGFIDMPDTSHLIHSDVIAFNDGQCFKLSNGITVFLEKGNDIFTISCEAGEAQKIIITSYPNPAIANVIIKAKSPLSNILPDNQKVEIGIFNALGYKIKTVTTVYKELSAGIKVEVSSLSAGIYIIYVTSGKISGSLKIIKATN